MNDTPEAGWARIVELLNKGSEEHDGGELYDLCDELIRWIEGGNPWPRNLLIRPGLSRDGFCHLLYLVRNGIALEVGERE